MTIPFTLALAIGFFGFVAGFLLAAAVLPQRQADDLKPQVLAAMHEVERWEAPRLLEWTPETRARFRAQQSGRV